MRLGTPIVAALAAGLLTVGAAAPAYAVTGAGSAVANPGSTERLETNGQDRTAGMGRMHEQMMKGMSDNISMEDMMQNVPGMTKMREQMMADHPADKTPPAQARLKEEV